MQIHSILVGLASLCVLGAAAECQSQEVEIQKRPMVRALNDVLEELENLDGDVRSTEVPQRERDSLRRTLDKVRSRINALKQALHRPPPKRGGILIDGRELLDDVSDAARALKRLQEDIENSSALPIPKKKLLNQRVRIAMVRLFDAKTLLQEAKPSQRVTQKTEAYAMETEPFSDLLTRLRSTSFESDKIALIRTAARSNLFTCDQVIALVSLLDFDNDRIDAAAALYPRTSNKKNWFKVYSVFAFDSSKEDLRRQIEK